MDLFEPQVVQIDNTKIDLEAICKEAGVGSITVENQTQEIIVIRIAAKGVTTKCADISHYEKNIDWDVVAKQNLGCLVLKCSQGVSLPDVTYAGFDKKCDDIGLIHGAYHYFQKGAPGLPQAENFLRNIGDSNPDFIAIDWEDKSGTPGPHDRDQGLIFLSRVQAAVKKYALIYGGPYFLQDLRLNSSDVVKNPLWISHYTEHSPLIPSPFLDWKMWQYAEDGIIPGIGHCDVNLYNGSVGDISRMLVELDL